MTLLKHRTEVFDRVHDAPRIYDVLKEGIFVRSMSSGLTFTIETLTLIQKGHDHITLFDRRLVRVRNEIFTLIVSTSRWPANATICLIIQLLVNIEQKFWSRFSNETKWSEYKI